MSPNRKFRRRPSWPAIVTVLLLAALAVPTGLLLTARAAEGTDAAVPQTATGNPPAAAERVLAVNSDGQKTEDGWTYCYGLSEPDWSPDGKWIAFTKHLKVYRPEHKTWYGTYETWVASPDGKVVRKIARGLKLFWDRPGSLTFAHSTEEARKTVTHFAAYDIATNQQVELSTKPKIPSAHVLLAGRSYSILATSAYNECMADPGRKELLAALQERLPDLGRLVGDITARDGIVLLSRSYLGPPDGPSGKDIWHVPTHDPRQARVLIPNASNPALSPDHRTVAYIRDGNLWVTRLPGPVTGPSATHPATQPAAGGPRETAEAFLAAVAAGEVDKALTCTTETYARDHRREVVALVGNADLSAAKVTHVEQAGADAAVVFAPINPKAGGWPGGPISLGVGLRRVGQAWRVRDLDALPHEHAVKEYLEGFRRAFPGATTAPRLVPATQPAGG